MNGFMKLSSETLKLIEKLNDADREKVDAMLKAHIKACRNQGFTPDDVNRYIVEAVESIRIDQGKKGKKIVEKKNDGGPDYPPELMKYHQYTSPKASWFER